MSVPSLAQQTWSLDHTALIDLIAKTENVLIIQDLDGVCMGLVKDPLTRQIDPAYIQAVQTLGNHFSVLTNGEHIGSRGINHIVDQALQAANIEQTGLYLPGLAGGGVQWQDRFGTVTHPGVREAELDFLAAIPDRMTQYLQVHLQKSDLSIDTETIHQWIQTAVLDNPVSPTANLNVFTPLLQQHPQVYIELQQALQVLMMQLLQEAQAQGLADSFFVHYAPNLGRDQTGQERVQWAQGLNSGTTDFQFMLRGAVKEAGVAVILNNYVAQRTGTYPLGEGFNVREAPRSHDQLLNLIVDRFDSAQLPTIIGVGDTVTSKAVVDAEGETQFQRGGSDRGFLQLVQDVGKATHRPNVVVYVDSSGGEVKNRKPVKLAHRNPEQSSMTVIEGPCDPQDTRDPLTLNLIFPDGYRQYIHCFIEATNRRLASI